MKFSSVSFTFLLLLICLRFYTTRPVYKNGDFVKITARVYTEPNIYENKNFENSVQYLSLKRLKIYLPRYPEIIYGDVVEIVGTINNGKLENPKLLKITESKNIFTNLRKNLISFYKSSLPEPYSSLVAGITIGSKNMPDSFWNKLKKTGTAHVVVASGTNVTMFSSFLLLILTKFVNRKYAVFITIAGILIYVILSGFDAPIIRAAVMGTIVLFGQSMGRITTSIRILLYSAALMLLIKPDFIFDLGFILSFVASFSLIIFQKKVSDRLKWVPEIFKEGLSTSISAQIGVTPIIYATFGQFNILSPIVNALILWTIPYIMVFGAVAGIIGLVVPLIGRLILFVIFPMLWFFEKVITIFSN